MYHWVIFLGLAVGLMETVSGETLWVWFVVRVIGTCAVLYVFFLCRMLGAGDIKLMAVCVGCLGVRYGVLVIFCGMCLALAAAFFKGKVWKYGWLMIRGQKMRLAPYLFVGECVVMSIRWLEGI